LFFFVYGLFAGIIDRVTGGWKLTSRDCIAINRSHRKRMAIRYRGSNRHLLPGGSLAIGAVGVSSHVVGSRKVESIQLVVASATANDVRLDEVDLLASAAAKGVGLRVIDAGVVGVVVDDHENLVGGSYWMKIMNSLYFKMY